MRRRGQWFPMRGGGALGRLILILRLSTILRNGESSSYKEMLSNGDTGKSGTNGHWFESLENVAKIIVRSIRRERAFQKSR